MRRLCIGGQRAVGTEKCFLEATHDFLRERGIFALVVRMAENAGNFGEYARL